MEKIHVSRARLHELFQDHGVWELLQQGTYVFNPLKDKGRVPVRPGHQPQGGAQVIHKWRDALGRHVATTHMVLDADGWPVHWDEKDLAIGEFKYIHRWELD